MPQENRKTLVKMSLFQDNVVCQVADLKKKRKCFLLISRRPLEIRERKWEYWWVRYHFPRFFSIFDFWRLKLKMSHKYLTYDYKKQQKSKKWLDGVYKKCFRFCQFLPIFLVWNASKFRFLWVNSYWYFLIEFLTSIFGAKIQFYTFDLLSVLIETGLALTDISALFPFRARDNP